MGSPSEHHWLEQERLRNLFEQPRLIDGLPIATAVLTVLSLRASASYPALALWLAGIILTTIGLSRLRARWRKNPGQHTARGWNLRNTAWLHLEGWLWAVLGSAFLPVESQSQELLVAFVLAGMAAIMLTLYAATLLPFVAFAGPPLAALAIRFGLSDQAGFQTLSALSVSYLLVLVGVALAIRQKNTEALTLRWRHEQLLREYTDANRSLLDKTRTQAKTHRKLVQRDDILQAVRFAAERLLNSRSWDSDPAQILERLGRASGVDHVHLVHHRFDDKGGVLPIRSYRWWGPSASSASKSKRPLVAASDLVWRRRLLNRQPILATHNEIEGATGELLKGHGVLSIAVVPIHVGDSWWGCLTFEDHVTVRDWSGPVVEALSSAADMLAAAIQGIRVEEALKTSDDRFRLLAENTSDLICLHRPDGSLAYVSPASENLLGYSPKQLQALGLFSIAAREDREELRRTLGRVTDEDLAGRGGSLATMLKVRNRRGNWLWVETRIQPIFDAQHNLRHFVTSTRDVTTRKHAEEQLFREKELAQVTLRSISDGVVTTDAAGKIRYLNPVAEKMVGADVSQLDGARLLDALAHRGSGASLVSQLADAAFNQREVMVAAEPVLLEDDSEGELAVEVSAAPLLDHRGLTLGTVTVLRDVTKTRELAQQLSYQASHDPLTGLLNRREFENRLAASVADRRAGTQDALAYLDLDQFKIVNDTCGHAAGDELLRQISSVLASRVRSTDVVARLGGDEFGLLLTQCPVDRARTVTNGICQAVRAFRFTWKDKVFQVGVSIGVVPVTPEVADTEELLSAADAACYVAKDLGRNRVHIYKPNDRDLAHRKGEMEWVSQIHGALEDDRFELYYQPIVESSSKLVEPRCIEILVRMITENGKQIPPGSFIPAAERFNSMAAIDRWVIESAISSFADHWHTRAPLVAECFINLSATSLTDPSFGDFVKRQLLEHEVPAGVLCFEITETAAITNLREARRLILELREMGCRFALDDFGAGLSSFAYLRSLPVDFLKIDGNFVKNIDQDAIGFSIVESINKVGQKMGLKTIAEFVENRAVRDRLMVLGVDYLQGFGLARPQPVKNLLEDLVVDLEVTAAHQRLQLTV
jgi:diguanylate cyclase (GGDEF)-like protein/PAS domain S-box-containing protein